MSTLAWRQWLAACLLTMSAMPVSADSPDVFSGYRLSSWGPSDGLTAGVYALAQDAAGFLWLGTETGLSRFDGVTFSTWRSFGPTQLPNVPIRALWAGRDGSLWIGFGFARGVSRVHAGKVTNYSERNALPPIDVSALVEDRTGAMWAGTSQGLYRFANDTWTRWPDDRGLPAGPVFSAFVDRSGSLIIGTSLGIFAMSAEQNAFQQIDALADRASVAEFFRSFGGDTLRAIIEDERGVLWFTDPTVGFRRADRSEPANRSGRGSALVRDRRGQMWVGMWDQGLWRVSYDPRQSSYTVARATAADGLIGDSVRSLLEDQEGNLWVGTLDGLNRLSPHKVTSIVNLGLVNSVGVSPDGSMWVGSAGGLIEFRGDQRRDQKVFQQIAPTLLTAVDVDEHGNIWASTRSDLLLRQSEQRGFVKLAGLEALSQIRLIASDKHGGCWLYDLDHGLFHWKDGLLEVPPLPTELRSPRTVAMYVDRGARLWLSLTDGRLATIDHDGTILVRGLVGDVGVYRAMYQDDSGAMWFGGSGGITRFQDGQFSTLRRTDAFPADSVAGIVDDVSGALWLGTGSGIIRILRDDFDRAVTNQTTWIRHSFYDTSDGLAGTPRWFGKRTAARASDGRLWFVTSGGVTILDPKVLPDSRPTSPVGIEAIVADGQRLAAESEMSLPAGTGRFVVHYEVPSLTSALKTRFRYMLDGFDQDWNYAGIGRAAGYTNCTAGTVSVPSRRGQQRRSVGGTRCHAHAVDRTEVLSDGVVHRPVCRRVGRRGGLGVAGPPGSTSQTVHDCARRTASAEP